MSKMSLLKKVVVAGIALLAITFTAAPIVSASQPRDYNSNAVMYGGALTYADLINKYDHGTGQPYQSSTELQNLYTTLGMGKEYFPNLVEGRVYKDGRVIVNGKTVWTNAESMGRHNLSGSTRDTRFPYPVYWRSTKVSFNSDSIPAFVYVNSDGKMAFAIIKSCGNPVKGEGVKKEQTYNLTIKKFEDKNSNAKFDSGEPMLQGWKFTVTGDKYEKVVETGKDGVVTLTGLKKGTYKIKEQLIADWGCTTGVERTVTISDKNDEVWYGNRKKEVTPQNSYNIIAKKYEDADADAKHDDDEKWIEGWSIKLTGNGVSKEYLTDAEGEVTFTNLPAGTYTVTEGQKPGWKNITPLSQTVVLPSTTGGNPIVEFGNQQVKEAVVTPQGNPLPVSGPVDAIAGTFGIVGLGGSGAYYLKGKKTLLSTLRKIK